MPEQIKVLYIRRWRLLYENTKTRLLVAPEQIPIPADEDREAYIELVAGHKDGPAHYGLFHALLRIAAKADPRGMLLRKSGEPYDVRALSLAVSMPVALVQDGIDRLCSRNIRWMGCADVENLSDIESGDGDWHFRPVRVGKKNRRGRKAKPFAIASGEAPSEEISHRELLEKQAEEIYWLYPRHVKPNTAKRAIVKALRVKGYEALKAAVVEYAKAREGEDEKWTPYPASWFNAGSYDEDPATWWRGKKSTKTLFGGITQFLSRHRTGGRDEQDGVRTDSGSDGSGNGTGDTQRAGGSLLPAPGGLVVRGSHTRNGAGGHGTPGQLPPAGRTDP